MPGRDPGCLLCDAGSWEKREVPPPPFARTLDFLEHDGHTLWALTAMFARDLVGRLPELT